jgi:hypothetical protein
VDKENNNTTTDLLIYKKNEENKVGRSQNHPEEV